MLVGSTEFYSEITGSKSPNTETAVKALKRWGIPLEGGNGDPTRRQHYKVDIQHLEEARAKWKLECVQHPPKAAKAASDRAARDDAINQRLDAMGSRLDDIIGRMRGLEVAMNALLKLAKS